MMRTAVILLGPPGGGKGTQARFLSCSCRFPAISTGDILREAVGAGTELGNQARRYMESGALVPDELVDGIVEQRLQREDCASGFILDGYPRTLAQARFLEALLSRQNTRTVVVGIRVGNQALIHRLTSRWVCPMCKKVFNAAQNPAVAGSRCDECNTVLVSRKDDSVEVIEERLQVYERSTAPLIRYYSEKGYYREVDGEQPVEQIAQAIGRIVGSACAEV